MILAGDVGGTNTRLAAFEEDPPRIRPEWMETFPSREYAGLEEIAEWFLKRRKLRVTGACFGIAGPVRGGRCEATNLPWVVDARHTAARLGCEQVRLLNDLEANAYGIAVLGPDDFTVLNQGVRAACGNQALIAAGTGLGEAGMVSEAGGYRPVASEGGHADFAPRNDLEMDLLRHLIGKCSESSQGHVSYERILSGPGLVGIYEFLRSTGRGAEPSWLADEMAKGDPAAVISRHGGGNSSEICAQALSLFVSVYGAEAGNLGLKFFAAGGLFIGGGIAPKISRKLQEPAFMQAFTAKGRLSKVLEDMPVSVIMNDNAPLLGAALVALRACAA